MMEAVVHLLQEPHPPCANKDDAARVAYTSYAVHATTVSGVKRKATDIARQIWKACDRVNTFGKTYRSLPWYIQFTYDCTVYHRQFADDITCKGMGRWKTFK